ncbi:X-ray radiation resistance-associated protein 1 isoform X2 [Hoplias malabaricus]
MNLHYVDQPSDLCSVDISEKKFQQFMLEGLEEFGSVAYINASDNCLSLEAFRIFPALRELELSLNGICTLEVNAENFPKLEVLDLSYNNLSVDGILALGLIPRLKVLHLTGNKLQILPPDMAGHYTIQKERAPQSGSLFQCLEVLMLDDNKLSSPGIFSSLMNLKRLQHLNLERNYISEVPYPEEVPLVQLPSSSVLETEGSPDEVSKTKYISEPNMDKQGFINEAVDEEKGARPYSTDFCPPFPKLQYLNLASNKIAEEEALLAVALFPMLSELIIHSNPLTTQKSGDPPLLTCFLQERLGVKIRRKKTAAVVKPHIVLPVKSERKVRTKIPKVAKAPFITAALCDLESCCTKRGNKTTSLLPSECRSTNVLLPCSLQSSTEEREEDIAAATESELLKDAGIPSETQQTHWPIQTEPFFVTEVNDLLKPECQGKTEETEHNAKILRQDTKDWPEKLVGYEALNDDNLDFVMPEPVGIQHSVKILEHTLRNLLVYRDSKANLDHLQRPCREQQKRIRNLPPVKPCKPKGAKVKEILTEMKENKTTSVIPLEKAIGSKDLYRREYEEALVLLKDMKRKYSMVHMKAKEQAANMENMVINLKSI